jgi:6-phosphogluconolactonase
MQPSSMRKRDFLTLGFLLLVAGCDEATASDDLDVRGEGATRGSDSGPERAESDAATADAGQPLDASPESLVPATDASVEVVESFVYVGGWDWSSGQPYRARSYTLSHLNGMLGPIETSDVLGYNPSHIAPSLDGVHLYVANELEGARAGITVAKVDRGTGRLTRVDHAPYAEGAFVYTRVHPSGAYLLAADYYAGGLVAYRLAPDGMLGEVADRVAFERKSETESAQTHSVGIHGNGKWVFAPNKALDAIAQLTFDVNTGRLSLRASHRSEGGPRHIAVHADLAFVMHEADSHLASYRIDEQGNLNDVDRKSALPAGFAGKSTGGHVLVHPSGRFVYVSNRGHDSIAVFASTADGRLSLLQHVPTQGKTPRHFDIDARGELLIVANQGSDGADDGSLVGFTIGRDGRLTPRGSAATGLKSPTTVVLVGR